MTVQWSAAYCGGAWVISGYEAVASALRDPRFSVRRAARWINSSSSGSAHALEEGEAQRRFKRIFARSLLFLDGRAHRRLRDVLNPGFKPAELQSQRPVITALAVQLLDAIRTDCEGAQGFAQGFDFIERFARPLPALVIARLMGLPGQPPAAFIDWAADLAAFIGSPTPDAAQTRAAQTALDALCAFFLQVLEEPAQLPAHSLLARLLLARHEERLRQYELLAQCATLLFAGYETTRNLLGNGLLALLRHPEQWAALRQEPALLRTAVREMLRYDSPVQYTGRRLLDDVVLDGRTLRRGDLAILHIGLANHDASRFSQPQRFDIRRDQGLHLSFGQGPHVCLGAALTQMEAEIAFTALMQKLPKVALAEAAPVWQDNAAYRALARLPLVF